MAARSKATAGTLLDPALSETERQKIKDEVNAQLEAEGSVDKLQFNHMRPRNKYAPTASTAPTPPPVDPHQAALDRLRDDFNKAIADTSRDSGQAIVDLIVQWEQTHGDESWRTVLAAEDFIDVSPYVMDLLDQLPADAKDQIEVPASEAAAAEAAAAAQQRILEMRRVEVIAPEKPINITEQFTVTFVLYHEAIPREAGCQLDGRAAEGREGVGCFFEQGGVLINRISEETDGDKFRRIRITFTPTATGDVVTPVLGATLHKIKYILPAVTVTVQEPPTTADEVYQAAIVSRSPQQWGAAEKGFLLWLLLLRQKSGSSIFEIQTLRQGGFSTPSLTEQYIQALIRLGAARRLGPHQLLLQADGLFARRFAITNS